MANRFWELELPIGDPFRGAPYGERTEPATLTALAVAAAGAVAGAVVSSALAPKPKAPTPPVAPTTVTENAADKQALDAQKRQRAAAAAAMGRSDTILTGPAGLGSASQAGDVTPKTILGS